MTAAKRPELTPKQLKTLTEDIPQRLAEETHDAWTGEPRTAATCLEWARRRGVISTDGYRFWQELCKHGVPKDGSPFYDYPCSCCGQLIGPRGLVDGKCEACCV